jgi:hypothetical protein
MLIRTLLAAALVASLTFASAQGSGGAPAQQDAQSQGAAAAPKQEEQKQQDPSSDKKKKKDKKKKSDKADQDTLDTTVFSERVANDVLGQIRDGLEGHTQRLMLGAFDRDKMDGFLQFEDQIEAYFNRYNGFRVHFTIVQTAVEGPRGIVLVNARIEQIPSAGGAPVNKAGQLRFELERGRKGWKVVDFHNRGFFS